MRKKLYYVEATVCDDENVWSDGCYVSAFTEGEARREGNLLIARTLQEEQIVCRISAVEEIDE